MYLMYYFSSDCADIEQIWAAVSAEERMVAAGVEPRPSLMMQLGQLLVLGDLALFLAIANQ